jgi:hypothetical protein
MLFEIKPQSQPYQKVWYILKNFLITHPITQFLCSYRNESGGNDTFKIKRLESNFQ